MVEPVTGSLALSGSTKMLSNLTDDLYIYLKGKVKLKLTKSDVDNKLPELINKINSIRLVKTLWQADIAIDIETFYCDSNVIIYNRNQEVGPRFKIETTDDFGPKRNIVIRGIAGQGKSIFLRHLCIKEFEAGQRIPVFIELRRIQQNETLLEHISRFFDILGLNIDHALFQILAKSGKFIFFLDGFDEIPDDSKSIIINELEYLASITSDCQFIVTSRPNTSIEMSSLFNVVRLDNLKGNEYVAVIRKLAGSSDYANILIKKVKSNKVNISALLCTPLLVTLLILSYKSFQKLPEQLSDFYESIFFVLLQKHDGSKPGFIRKRGCSINDNQYREIFDALCFESKRLKGSFISYQVIYNQVKGAMNLSNIQEDADKYLKDIVNITCLILQEGDEYRFIHNSVQEYYAASFIKNRPETIVERFYSKCLDDERMTSQWMQELEYLSHIDKYGYNKYYLMPLLQKWMDCYDTDILLLEPPPITTSRMRGIFSLYDLTFIVGELDSSSGDANKHDIGLILISGAYKIFSPIAYCPNILTHKCFRIDYHLLYNKMLKHDLIINKELLLDPSENYDIKPNISYSPSNEHSMNKFKISLQQVIDEGVAITELQALAENIIAYIHSQWKSAFEYVHSKDSLDISTYFLL